MAAVPAGGAASMYMVQIDSLQTYQKQLTTILKDLQNGQQSKLDHAGTGASVFGNFPEAVSFSDAFENVRQGLITSFGEITDLVEAMIKALGTSASNYQAVEDQIAQQFNAISSQYGNAQVSLSGPATSTSTTTSATGTGSGTTTSTSASTSATAGTGTGTGQTYALSGTTGTTGTTGTGETSGSTGNSGSGTTSTGTDDANASAGALG